MGELAQKQAGPGPRSVRPPPAQKPAAATPTLASAVGNQAMQNLLRGGWLRAKLEVGGVDDPEEREADAVAGALGRAQDPVGCASCGAGGSCEDQTVRRKPEAAKPARPGRPALPRSLEHHVRGLTSGGEPLAPSLRLFFEPRLGQDLGQVRVHRDADAQAAAQAIQAQAFTFGQHIGFASGRFEPGSQQGRRLLAHELAHVAQPYIAGPRVRRQPAEEAEIEMPADWVFTGGKRTDRRYARSLAIADSARIRKAGTLSPQDREEINAKLRFFEGAAWQTYSETIRPALVQVTQEEITMPAEEFGSTGPGESTKPKRQPYDITDQFKRLREYPEYIDNNIKEVNYFSAETAIIHYRDGSKFELGLVRRWMKPPVVEVDCHTPAEQFRKFEDASTGRFGFIVEAEMANAPRSMPHRELLKTYVHYIDFHMQAGTARVVPSRINMLTAPKLCGILRDSERRYREQVEMAVQIGLGGTAAIGGYAGGGGFSKGPGVGLGTTVATRAALSPTARTLAREMDSLLATGAKKTITVEGVRFAEVTVSRQGNVLAVRRFMTEIPEALRGQGLGTRVTAAFEDAAAEIGRLTGAKTVTIDVGLIRNPGWGAVLEARGYVRTQLAGREAWVKTIKVAD